jgi:hypothetical protein
VTPAARAEQLRLARAARKPRERRPAAPPAPKRKYGVKKLRQARARALLAVVPKVSRARYMTQTQLNSWLDRRALTFIANGYNVFAGSAEDVEAFLDKYEKQYQVGGVVM